MLAADTATDRGSPDRSDRTWIFEPLLPRSTGFGPVMDPPLFRPDGRSVTDRTGPVDHPLTTEFIKDHAVQPGP
ncbi:hypothetical protein GCM10022222_66990 [Amycolatopsis ultiminotia]|uniref:Uncharacterized protein n=1 Tax=Amycolatopsis ultiminotia TaxID=543629 RepID=A0ABP6XY71_9PSEU